MKIQTLIEILDAAHMSRYVSSPFTQRGGIVLVAPPGQMKSSLINAALDDYGDAVVMSDVNVQTLMKLKHSIIGQKTNTLAFVAMEKLYARNASTARNVEASLMAFMEEGFTKASFQNQKGPPSPAARALIVAGTFTSHVEMHWDEWEKSGMTRRVLWIYYTLANPDEIINAIHYWNPLDIGSKLKKFPIGRIPYKLTDVESGFILDIMRDQREATPIVLMKKIFCILKWKYGDKRAKEILLDFEPSLKKTGAEIELPEAQPVSSEHYQEAESQ